MAGTSAEVPGLYPISLNGRAYLLDLSQGAFRRKTVPLMRPQADTSNIPGKGSINPEDLWRRDQETWHFGADQDVFDREDSRPGRFKFSKGIDPWTRWKISLLHDTRDIYHGTNVGDLLVPTDQFLYWAHNLDHQLSRCPDPSVVNPDFDSVTSLGTERIWSLTTDGDTVYVAQDTDGVYKVEPGSLVATHLSTATGVAATKIGYVKGRLMVADSQQGMVWNVVGSGALTVDNTLFTHPNDSFEIVGFSEGPGHIYFGGFVGGRGEIYRIQIQPEGEALDFPIQAGVLPDGETLHSLLGYLGFMVLGTSKGVRIALIDGNGDLTIGPLIETDEHVDALVARDRFVWFGGYRDGFNPGTYRMDLSVFTEPLKPAYATDLMINATDRAKNLCFFNDRMYLTSHGDGLRVEIDDLVNVGIIESGDITFGIPDTKVALLDTVRHEALQGAVDLSIKKDNGTFFLYGSNVTENSLAFTTSIGDGVGSTFEVRLTLKRSSGNLALGPVVTSNLLKIEPRPQRSELITLPILLHERQEIDGQERTIDVRFELGQLRGMAAVPATVAYKETDVTVSCFVKDVEWIPHHEMEDGSFWNGVAMVTIRTVPEFAPIDVIEDPIIIPPPDDEEPDPDPDPDPDDEEEPPPNQVGLSILDFSDTEGTDVGELVVNSLDPGGSNVSDQSVYTTTVPVSPTDNALVLVTIANSDILGLAVPPTSVTGAGLTFVKVKDQTMTSTGRLNVSLWRAQAASPGTGTLTITFPGVMGACMWQVLELEGVPFGNNGGDAIVQSASSIVGPTAASVTLANAPADGNALIGAFVKNSAGSTATPGAGFSQRGTGAGGGVDNPQIQLFVESALSVTGHDGIIDVTWGGLTNVAQVAAEIASSSGVGSTKVFHIPVQLSGALPMDMMFTFQTIDATATAGLDYLSVTGVGVILAGATAVNVSVEVIQDDVPESDKELLILISDPKNALTGEAIPGLSITRAISVVTIVDDDDEGQGEEPPPQNTDFKVMHSFYQGVNDFSKLAGMETGFGKGIAAFRHYNQHNLPSAGALTAANNLNAVLAISCNNKDSGLTWEQVGAGADDDFIHNWGRTLQHGISGDEVIFIFMHEPHDNVAECGDCGAKGSATFKSKGAADYRAAWRRFHDRFRAQGIAEDGISWLRKDGQGGKIVLGYCAVLSWALKWNQADQLDLADPDPLYPGNDVIDVLCHDDYNGLGGYRLFGLPEGGAVPQGMNRRSWRDALELCEHLGKPLMIGEWGSLPKDAPQDFCNVSGENIEMGPFPAGLNTALTGLGHTADRDGWLRQASEFIRTDPLARKWFAGGIYYQDRGWMFVKTDGTNAPHPSGCIGITTGPGVEGITGWVDGFVNHNEFVPTPVPFFGATGVSQYPRGTVTPPPDNGFPTINKIVVVLEENTNRSQIIGSAQAPWINRFVGAGNRAANAAVFTDAHGVIHPSQGNYVALFSGQLNGITDDACSAAVRLTTPNLGAQLRAKSKTFVTYSETLPSDGYDGCSSGKYFRKHNPVANWMGSGTNQMPGAEVNKRWTQFPTNFDLLPDVSFVVPNQDNDMHDPAADDNLRINNGDDWLAANIDAYAQWAMLNDSLLIVAWDESELSSTDNNCPLFIYGPMVNGGNYGRHVDHYDILRTIQDIYGITPNDNAIAAVPITEIFEGGGDPDPEPGDDCANTTVWTRLQGTGQSFADSGTAAEISGVCSTPNFASGIWGVRDSGQPATLYWYPQSGAGDPLTFGAGKAFPLTGTEVGQGDWEDLYYAEVGGQPKLFIHDNRDGNGAGVQARRLYQIAEPDAAGAAHSVAVEANYRWMFPTETGIPNNCPSSTATQNCEAIAIFEGRFYALRKKDYASGNGAGGRTKLYDFGPVGSLSTSEASPTIGTYVGDIECGCPSAMPITADGNLIMVLRQGRLKFWKRGAQSGIQRFLVGNATLLKNDQPPAIGGQAASHESGTWYPYGSCSLFTVTESRTITYYKAT